MSQDKRHYYCGNCCSRLRNKDNKKKFWITEGHKAKFFKGSPVETQICQDCEVEWRNRARSPQPNSLRNNSMSDCLLLLLISAWGECAQPVYTVNNNNDVMITFRTSPSSQTYQKTDNMDVGVDNKDTRWFPTKENIENILSNHLEFDREILLHFSKHESSKYETRKGFIRGFERYLDRCQLVCNDFSKYCRIDKLTKEELVKKLKQTINELNDALSTAKTTELKMNDIKEQLQYYKNNEFIQTIITGNQQMSAKYGKNWDDSFLKAFTTFCFESIVVDDNRGLRYDKKEHENILRLLQSVLTIGGSQVYRLLRGPGNPKNDNNHQFDPKNMNFPLPTLETVNSTIPYTHIGSGTNVTDDYMTSIIELFHCKQQPVVLSMDSMYIRSVTIIDPKTNSIIGLQKPIPCNEFISSKEIIKDAKQFKQVFTVLMSNIDNSSTMPLFWMPFANNLKDIRESIMKMVPHLENVGLKICAMVSDGDFSCQSLIKDAHIALKTVHPFSDYDHLLKTIRNNMCPNSNKKDKRKKTSAKDRQTYKMTLTTGEAIEIKWTHIIDCWNENNILRMPPYNIPKGAIIDIVDLMSSQYMQVVFSQMLSKYFITKSTNIDDSNSQLRKEYFVLGKFIGLCADYFQSFDSSDQTTLDQRLSTIYDTTDVLLKVDGLTPNAKRGLKMNKTSLKQLVKELELKGMKSLLVTRGLSTLTVENFFSKSRARNPNPNIAEFSRDFDKIANELQKDNHADQLNYNIKLTNTQQHHYSKRIGSKSPPMKPLGRRKRKIGSKGRRGVMKPNKQQTIEVKVQLKSVENSNQPSGMNLRASYSKPKLMTSTNLLSPLSYNVLFGEKQQN